MKKEEANKEQEMLEKDNIDARVDNGEKANRNGGEAGENADEATANGGNVNNGADETTAGGDADNAEPKDPLTEAQEKIEALQEQLLYRQAEFENYRKRVIKEKAELLLNGAEKTVLAMLPVVDDFERAMANIAKADDVEALRQGIELIQQKFVKALEGLGVKSIDTKDAIFSTDLHEAIAQIPAPTDELKGKVIDCVQTGYTLNDKVIRYAKVAVGI